MQQWTTRLISGEREIIEIISNYFSLRGYSERQDMQQKSCGRAISLLTFIGRKPLGRRKRARVPYALRQPQWQQNDNHCRLLSASTSSASQTKYKDRNRKNTKITSNRGRTKNSSRKNKNMTRQERKRLEDELLRLSGTPGPAAVHQLRRTFDRTRYKERLSSSALMAILTRYADAGLPSPARRLINRALLDTRGGPGRYPRITHERKQAVDLGKVYKLLIRAHTRSFSPVLRAESASVLKEMRRPHLLVRKGAFGKTKEREERITLRPDAEAFSMVVAALRRDEAWEQLLDILAPSSSSSSTSSHPYPSKTDHRNEDIHMDGLILKDSSRGNVGTCSDKEDRDGAFVHAVSRLFQHPSSGGTFNLLIFSNHIVFIFFYNVLSCQ